MSERIVSLADAKARLSELADMAARGETVIITKRGKPVLQLSRIGKPRKPIDVEALRRLTAGMAMQPESSAEFMRRLRDQARH